MVETRKLADFSADERQNLLLAIYEVFKKHGVEKRLDSPKLIDELITDMRSKKFERQLNLQAKGTLKADESELATKIQEEVAEVLKYVDKANKRVGFSAKIGVGDQVGPITEANFVFEEGKTTVEHKEG